jgi:hypothetical protein
MAVGIGVWFALAGVPSVLVGLVGFRRARRLRRDGVKAWAVGVPRPVDDGVRRSALQYALPDGRVLETLAPGSARMTVRPGMSVLVWCDPADPLDILVYGREGRASNLVFAIVGAVLLLAGVGIAAFT